MGNSAKIKFKTIFGTDEKEHISELTNAKLITEDMFEFDIHKVTLSRKNDYFYRMFCCVDSKDRTAFFIPGVSGEVLNDVLVYLYTGKLYLSKENITALLIASDYFLVDDLSVKIEKSVHKLLHIDNCVPVLVHAHMINNACIFNAAFRFIQTHFDAVVFNHKEVLVDVPFELLNKFLCSKSLHISDERPVWFTIAQWVQKDLQNRLSRVPLLLAKHIAKKEVNETVAKEIISHSIVRNNPFCRVSNDYKSDTRYLPILLDFLSIHSDYLFDHRIPPKVTLVVKRVMNEETNAVNSHIYVTYDENLDLWRKVAEIDFYPEYLTSLNHNVYLFPSFGSTVHLNLKNNSVTRRFTFEDIISVGKFGRFIYVLTEDYGVTVNLFDPEDNLLRSVVPSYYVSFAMAASFSGNLYVIGESREMNRIVAQVYNPKAWIRTWSLIQPPAVNRRYSIFIVYHEKLFAIGGSDIRGTQTQTVEIFEPEEEVWRQVADMPMSYHRTAKAIIWDDKLFVYKIFRCGNKNKMKAILWKEPQECWEEVYEIPPLIESNSYHFCEIYDDETLGMLWKSHRSLNSELERSDFN